MYSSALIALLIAVPFTQLSGLAPGKAAQVPWWAWLGGLLTPALNKWLDPKQTVKTKNDCWPRCSLVFCRMIDTSEP